MKRALVIISLVALLVVPLGLVGCGGNTLSDSDLATIRGFAQRMDNAEEDIGDLQKDINKISSPDLSNYVTLEKYNELLAKYNALLDESDSNSLASKIKALEAKVNVSGSSGGSSTIPTSPTGQVTVTISNWQGVTAGPFYLYSTNTAASITFTVRVTNGTTAFQYVNWNLNLMRISGADDVIGIGTTTLLTRFTYPVTYTIISSPTAWDAATKVATNCNQLMFTYNTNSSFAVAPGAAIDVMNTITVTTSMAEQWQIILNSIYSTIWF